MSDGQEQKKKTTFQAGGGAPEQVKDAGGKLPSLDGFLKQKGVDTKQHKVAVFHKGKRVNEKDYDKPMKDGNYALATAPKAGEQNEGDAEIVGECNCGGNIRSTIPDKSHPGYNAQCDSCGVIQP
jgi:hypothetical protein